MTDCSLYTMYQLTDCQTCWFYEMTDCQTCTGFIRWLTVVYKQCIRFLIVSYTQYLRWLIVSYTQYCQLYTSHQLTDCQFIVRDNILEWVKSFLDGRTQRVVLDGTASLAAPVTLCPQRHGPGLTAIACIYQRSPIMCQVQRPPLCWWLSPVSTYQLLNRWQVAPRGPR